MGFLARAILALGIIQGQKGVYLGREFMLPPISSSPRRRLSVVLSSSAASRWESPSPPVSRHARGGGDDPGQPSFLRRREGREPLPHCPRAATVPDAARRLVAARGRRTSAPRMLRLVALADPDPVVLAAQSRRMADALWVVPIVIESTGYAGFVLGIVARDVAALLAPHSGCAMSCLARILHGVCCILAGESLYADIADIPPPLAFLLSFSRAWRADLLGMSRHLGWWARCWRPGPFWTWRVCCVVVPREAVILEAPSSRTQVPPGSSASTGASPFSWSSPGSLPMSSACPPRFPGGHGRAARRAQERLKVPPPPRVHDSRSRRTAAWETAALNPPSWTPWPLVAGSVPHASPVVLTFSGLPYQSSALSARPIPGMGWLGAVGDAGRRSLGAHGGAAAGHRGSRHSPAALSAMSQAIYTKLIVSAHIRSYKP